MAKTSSSPISQTQGEEDSRPGLRSALPSTAPNALPFSSQMPSSLVPGIMPLVLGTPAATSQQSSHQLPERIYFMSTVAHRLVLALASRLLYIFDVRRRKMDASEHTRELSQIPHPRRRLHVRRPRYLILPPFGQSIGSFRTLRGHLQLGLLLRGYATLKAPSPLSTSTPHRPSKRKGTHSGIIAKR